jgi:hypothetical protein
MPRLQDRGDSLDAINRLYVFTGRRERRGGGFNALQIILNNCGNALYFRTSDIQTQDNLRQRIPDPPVPNRPHVIKVQPLTTLAVGSCYALRSNGSWGLFKVHLPK